MKAWRVDPSARTLTFDDVPIPVARRGAVTARVEAAMVLSYMAEVLDGVRGDSLPERAFIPGTNAVGVIESVGEGVYHLQPGQRVFLQPHVLADERVRNPAQVLMGHNFRQGAGAEQLQNDWVDGTFAEVVEWPAAQVTPIDALGDLPPEQVLSLSKLVVPYGGFLRVGLQPGESVAVNGASGFYGSGGVLMALAMGATRVFALGRNEAALREVCSHDPRAIPVVLSGDSERDTANLKEQSHGGIDVALDVVGAASAKSTRSVLRSLNRSGRLAMMGSCTEPLAIDFGEMLMNDWLIAGQFMYPRTATAQLIELAAAGLLLLTAAKPRCFPLEELRDAMQHGTTMKGLDLTAVVP